MPLELSRRGLAGALLAAPAIIRTPGLLMPVKAIAPMPPAIKVTTDNRLVIRYRPLPQLRRAGNPTQFDVGPHPWSDMPPQWPELFTTS